MKRLLLLHTVLLLVSCLNLGDQKDWNNPFDNQGSDWHPPVVNAMDDDTVGIKDTAYLQVTGVDINGWVIRYDWSFNHGQSWDVHSDTGLGANLKWYFPKSTAGQNVIWVRAVDNHELNSAPDSFMITVLLYPPEVYGENPNTVIGINDTVLLKAIGADANGRVVKFFWSFDDGATWSIETLNGSLLRYYPLGSEGISKVMVKVLDDDTLESLPDTFTIDVRLYPPVAYIDDKMYGNIFDSLTVTAHGFDTNGVIVSYIWVQNDSAFTDTTSQPYLKIAYPDSGSYPIGLKVIDDDGLVSPAVSGNVTVTSDPPLLTPVANRVVSQLDTLTITVSAEDTNATGSIQKYYWDSGADGWEDSTSEPLHEFKNPAGGSMDVIWGARDDDGLLSSDTFAILFNRVPTSVTMLEPGAGQKAAFLSFNTSTVKGSVKLRFRADDPDGNSDTLRYKLQFGKEGGAMNTVYVGHDTLYVKENLDTSTAYQWKLTVHDLYGDSASAESTFRTPYVDLMPPVITLKGDNPMRLSLVKPYVEPGAVAVDNIDGDISDQITVGGIVNTSVAGTYSITYTVKDSMNNSASVTRSVIVESYIVLEDFESGPACQTTFGALFGSGGSDSVGFWRGWRSSSVTFEPDPYETDSAFEKVVVPNVGMSNSGGLSSWIRIWWIDGAYWGTSLYLKQCTKYYNLSGLDSITFWAKNGANGIAKNVRLQCTYPAIDSLATDKQWGYVGKEFTLTGDWKNFSIKPSAMTGITGSPGNGHTWDTAKAKVKMLQFISSSTDIDDVELFLDDIRIYGDFTNSGLLP